MFYYGKAERSMKTGKRDSDLIRAHLSMCIFVFELREFLFECVRKGATGHVCTTPHLSLSSALELVVPSSEKKEKSITSCGLKSKPGMCV